LTPDTGYRAQSLTGANWSFTDVSNVTTASYPAITWTFNAALNFGAGQQLSLTLNITLT
jgi:hypothetical protein